MREIKFRMKDYDGNWYYFGLGNATLTTKETLGQYTGLKDKNGTEIYEGDKVWYLSRTYTVYYDGLSFILVAHDGRKLRNIYSIQRGVVIGNIHDKPELQKGGSL